MGKLNLRKLRQHRPGLSRRAILQGIASLGAGAGLVGCGGRTDLDASDEPGPADGSAQGTFRHGVASGDPYPDSVVLWTRFSPANESPVSVSWLICTDEALLDVVDGGTFTTDAARDFTVKVIASGLQPYRHYWYQFKVGEIESVVGRTKTAPSPDMDIERLRFATTSCALYSFGYFNAYAGVARQDDLDVVFSLGDYIYEYGGDELFGTAILPDRQMVPAHQTVSLDDYRQRHALYKSDPDLQRAHARHPWICTWDDHETANNSYDDGAPDHDETVNGPWEDRKRAGIQAYFEWLPIREEFNPNNDGALYRHISYGQRADFFVLDTRLQGRDIQPARGQESGPDRMMMSAEQERWLIDGLRASSAQWKFIPQQTVMAQLDVLPGQPFLPDSWSGYTAQRDRLLDAFGGQDGGARIDNVVVLAGDIHSTFCNELTKNPLDITSYRPGLAGSVGVEFVCPSVTTPLAVPIVADLAFRATNPHIRYSEGTSDAGHGYTVINVGRDRIDVNYHYPISILIRTEYARVIGPLAVHDRLPFIDVAAILEQVQP